MLHFLVNGEAVPGEELFQLGVDAVAAVGLTDKVKHREALLLGGMAQAATELLEKDRQALGGAQEEDGVDLRHVHPCAQLVHGEEKGELAAFEM